MFHVNVALFMTTRIAFMAYLSSLTGMRRLALTAVAAGSTATRVFEADDVQGKFV